MNFHSKAFLREHPQSSVASASPLSRHTLMAALPLAIGLIMILLPAPPGLPLYSWRYLALFVTVIVGLIVEPVPAAAVGFLGITAGAALSHFVLFSPAQLAAPGFNANAAAISWALSGFSNSTVWLIFSAFVFSLGYEKTGLGKRISLLLLSRLGARTLTLGYAVMFADLLLAPFMPSNTARSGGTIFPVIKNIPEFYQSLPNDPSSRRIGSYLMWTAIASTCVTSSMFLTGLAPNILAVELVRKTVHVELGWGQWFIAFLPVGLILLATTPLLAYVLYPPELKRCPEVPAWARQQLGELGAFSGKEITLLILVILALALWIFGAQMVDPTTVALMVVGLLVVTRTITWTDVLDDKPAFNTLVWFGTLVALAAGLAQVGVVAWLAGLVGPLLATLPALAGLIALIVLFFLLHYLFASTTAHTTALLPLMLIVATKIPGLPIATAALGLCLSLGIMGIITPYGTGPSPVYAGSGFLPGRDYWRLGAIFGGYYLLVFLLVGVPMLFLVG
ncbi:anion transporter [Methylocella silvestris BL2]|uniref:Anion transporter n=1 Tax=Methylocella silvestris (strain DSM 15510 / CIP 108128 / LMG 27833 / NCIMB 13906 / BL2) TaxID=395965 RepID=B8EKD3_METSB|nr:DASS family sodium-coupled anion symporter [Methylocella silvestris]ACK50673.1 anion transporter [Methylocella silvestris BL2]